METLETLAARGIAPMMMRDGESLARRIRAKGYIEIAESEKEDTLHILEAVISAKLGLLDIPEPKVLDDADLKSSCSVM